MTDDFTRIRGINEDAANRLNEVGVLTYSKLASMSPEEIISRLGTEAGYTVEAIEKRDWINQASALALKSVAGESLEEVDISQADLTEVSYVIELLLDKHKRVRRTKVLHVKSNQEQVWKGWESARLLDYFVNRPELSLVDEKPFALLAKSSRTESSQKPAATFSESAKSNGLKKEPDNQIRSTTQLTSAGKVRPRLFEVINLLTNKPCNLFGEGKPYNLRLSLDLTEACLSDTEPLICIVVVNAIRMEDRWRQTICRNNCKIAPAKKVYLNFEGAALTAGIYRLVATVTLSQMPGRESQRRDYTVHLESSLIQIT